MPKYDNLRPLITPKRLHLISGAWKSLKGIISGPWKCQKSFISGPWKLQKGFSWFQGPEKAKKVSFQAPETAKMCERFFMCFWGKQNRYKCKYLMYPTISGSLHFIFYYTGEAGAPWQYTRIPPCAAIYWGSRALSSGGFGVLSQPGIINAYNI